MMMMEGGRREVEKERTLVIHTPPCAPYCDPGVCFERVMLPVIFLVIWL